MYRNLVYLLFIFLCLSCGQKTKESHWHSEFLRDSVSIEVEDNIKFIKPYFKKPGYLLILTNKALVKYSFSGNISLKMGLPKHQGGIIDFFAFNEDSIYYLTDIKRIILADTTGEIKRSWLIKGLSDNYINVFSEFPFVVNKNKAYFYQYPNFVINTSKNLALYLKTNREIIYDLDRDSIISNEYGTYPKDLTENNKYVFNPIRTIDGSNNLIYSFPHSDSIYVCNYVDKNCWVTTATCTGFKQNSLFDFGRINDFNYISQYLTENSRYGLMVYDKYKNIYYRVLSHSYEYHNNDNTINKWIDKPWTLIVLNNRFKKIKEIEFPGKRCDFTNIIPTDKGVLIGDYKTFIIDDTKKKKYEIYSF